MRWVRGVLVGLCGLMINTGVTWAQQELGSRAPDMYRAYVDDSGMLVVGWGSELTLAYDLQHGGLYKAWKGGRQVNDSLWAPSHGEDEGLVYSDGSIWPRAWQVKRNGQVELAEAVITRYALANEGLHVDYTLRLDSATDIMIREVATVSADTTGQVTWERTFTSTNVPLGVVVDMPLTVYALSSEQGLQTDGQWTPRMRMQFVAGEALQYGLQGHLRLNPNAATKLTLSFAPHAGQVIEPLHVSQTSTPARVPSNSVIDPTVLPTGITLRDHSFDALASPVTALTNGPSDYLTLATADTQGTIWLGDDVALRLFATGLLRPLGVASAENGTYILEADRLTQAQDQDGDGVADTYSLVSNAWNTACTTPTSLFHESAQFYVGLRATCASETSQVLAITADRRATTLLDSLVAPRVVTAQQGIVWVIDQQENGAIAHVVHTEASVSSTLWFPAGTATLGQPERLQAGLFGGQWFIGDGAGNLYRVALEQVGGRWQGAVMALSKGRVIDAQHVVAGNEGQLYIASGNRLAILQLPTASYFDIEAAALKSNGIELSFTEPLAEGYGWNVASYRIRQEALGGENELSADVIVRSASVAEDRRSVFLEIDNLASNHVLHITIDGPLPSEQGVPIWSREVWYTINELPTDARGVVRTQPTLPLPNTLTAAEVTDGWRLLFDGASLSGWRGYKQRRAPRSWRAEAGELMRTDHDQQVDLITQLAYTNFELSFEWRLADGSSGGVLYGVSEEGQLAQETGIAYRLQSEGGTLTEASAGAANDVLAPLYDVVRDSSTYNHTLIRVEGNTVEHWLNGFKVLTYDRSSEPWQAVVQNSPFPAMGQVRTGHLVLQDTGGSIAFRNIKMRPLPD